MRKKIKLSEYARRNGLSYHTAYNLFKTDQIAGAEQSEDGKTILVPVYDSNYEELLDARISGLQNLHDLVGGMLEKYASTFEELAESEKNEEMKEFYKELADDCKEGLDIQTESDSEYVSKLKEEKTKRVEGLKRTNKLIDKLEERIVNLGRDSLKANTVSKGFSAIN